MTGWDLMGIGAVTVIVDQVTKAIAVRGRGEHTASGACRLAVVRLADARRWTRAAATAPALVGLWLLAVACAAVALTAGPEAGARPLPAIGVVLALGGATGNLGDRLARGGVVDFIDLPRWPRFNLADVAITSGVGLVGVGLL